ncbi:MAG: hypothetical protein V4708_06135 [Bacteroidota bacterium]
MIKEQRAKNKDPDFMPIVSWQNCLYRTYGPLCVQPGNLPTGRQAGNWQLVTGNFQQTSHLSPPRTYNV